MQFLRRWQILVAALAVAIVGFLSIHRYEPGPGLLWNIVHANIHLTPPCNVRPGLPDLSDLAVDGRSLWRGDCGIKLPYSWLLSSLVAFAVIGLLWPEGAGFGVLRRLIAPKRGGGPPPLPDPTLVGVRGWLLLLCVHLTIIGPLMTMGEVARTYQDVGPSFAVWPGLESYFIVTLALSLILILAGICVGVMLWLRRPGAHNITRRFLLLGLGVACLSPFSIYLFVDMPDGSARSVIEFGAPRFIAAVTVTLVWYFYLSKSERVRANFLSATEIAPGPKGFGFEQLQPPKPALASSRKVGWVAPLMLAAFFGFYHACTRNLRVDPPSNLTKAPPTASAPWIEPMLPPQGPTVFAPETPDKQKRFDAEKIAGLLNKVPQIGAGEITRPDGQAWRRIALREGIALEIPLTWILTRDREREAIEAFGKALFPSSTLKGRMGFGATLHASGGKILAQVGIRFYVDNAADDVQLTNVETATPEMIRQLDGNLRKGIEAGQEIRSWDGTRRAKTGAFASLVSEYVGRFRHEPFERRFVRARVYDGKLSFSLLLNYEESAGTSLRPTIDHIMGSLARAN